MPKQIYGIQVSCQLQHFRANTLLTFQHAYAKLYLLSKHKKMTEQAQTASETENPYDKLFDPSYTGDDLSVAGAVVHTPSLTEQLSLLSPDEYGVKRISGAEELNYFESALNSLGILAEAPREVDLAAMLHRAKVLVARGRAVSFLEQQPYTSRYDIDGLLQGAKKSLLAWGGERLLYIDPNSIVSGDKTLENWAGRSSAQQKTYTLASGGQRDGRIIDAVQEYAAGFSSQLPRLETFALNVVLARDSTICYVTSGINRTAAAKLRQEPLAFSSMVLYDAR